MQVSVWCDSTLLVAAVWQLQVQSNYLQASFPSFAAFYVFLKVQTSLKAFHYVMARSNTAATLMMWPIDQKEIALGNRHVRWPYNQSFSTMDSSDVEKKFSGNIVETH